MYEPSAYNNQTVISLGGSNRIFGAYFTDTISPSDLVHINAAVRYNLNTETINGYSVDTDPADYGNGFGDADLGQRRPLLRPLQSVDRLHDHADNMMTYYATYNEASRAPSVIELGCSDPSRAVRPAE